MVWCMGSSSPSVVELADVRRERSRRLSITRRAETQLALLASFQSFRCWSPLGVAAPSVAAHGRHHSWVLGSTPFALKSAMRRLASASMMSSSERKRNKVCMRASRPMTRQSQMVFARTVAVRLAATGFLQMAAISPKTEPSPSVATWTVFTKISTSPRFRMYMHSPLSPWRKMSVPLLKIWVVTCSASISTNSGLQRWKRPTPLRHTCVFSLTRSCVWKVLNRGHFSWPSRVASSTCV
mmetsp:Transcript_104421/g.336713  ORF Transcript_104421/g.336713 Transcript_104421/m.336713 type:complete len:239 (+) Transcript_104421:480-1196(+)